MDKFKVLDHGQNHGCGNSGVVIEGVIENTEEKYMKVVKGKVVRETFCHYCNYGFELGSNVDLIASEDEIIEEL